MLNERCDQVAKKRSAVGRVSAQVAVFGEASGHCCGPRWCLLLGVARRILVAWIESKCQNDCFRVVSSEGLLVYKAWVYRLETALLPAARMDIWVKPNSSLTKVRGSPVWEGCAR